MTFIDKCISGEAKPGEIDDYIAKWHDLRKSTPDHQGGGPIHTFLGMTDVEYAMWVEVVKRPRIRWFRACRRKKKNPNASRGLCVSHARGLDLENQCFIEAIVAARKGNTSAIPKGIYCYGHTKEHGGATYICPFLFQRRSMDRQSSGYCVLLGKGDWMEDGTMLLWDQCKECGINADLEDDELQSLDRSQNL